MVKSLNSLKHAPKQWPDRFDKILVSNGYATETKRMLTSNFNLKRIEEAYIILVIKITKTSDGLI